MRNPFNHSPILCMPTDLRSSPSGPRGSIKGTLALATTAVAVTALATQTGTFAGALVGDVVAVSPQANLQGAIAVAWARVVTTNLICVAFNNVGVSTATGAITLDCTVSRR